jgi:hypothetical protein
MQMRIIDTIRAVSRCREDTVRGATEEDKNQEMTFRATEHTTHLCLLMFRFALHCFQIKDS